MIFYGGEIYCTYLYIAGQRKIISKYLCCFPFRSTPNSRYCCSISHHSCIMWMKGFCKLKAADRKGKCTSSFFAFFSSGAAGPPEGRAGRLVLLIFRCGSRALWFSTSRTLCFPTLGWILSPWILYPRWACIQLILFVRFARNFLHRKLKSTY